jgi:uncharacterized membrane protein YfcA
MRFSIRPPRRQISGKNQAKICEISGEIMLVALLLGLSLGLLHVVTGPDHLGAIAPMASVERQRVWSIGLRWGLGHSLGVLGVALLAGLVAHLALIDVVSQTSERLVGIMLIAIAAWGWWRFQHYHHDHTSTSARPSGRFAPYAIGIVHGCAGGSHLVGILMLLTFPTLAGIFSYVAGFVVGTVLAMTAFAAGIGWLVTTQRFSERRMKWLLLGSTICSASIGVWWLI